LVLPCCLACHAGSEHDTGRPGDLPQHGSEAKQLMKGYRTPCLRNGCLTMPIHLQSVKTSRASPCHGSATAWSGEVAKTARKGAETRVTRVQSYCNDDNYTVHDRGLHAMHTHRRSTIPDPPSEVAPGGVRRERAGGGKSTYGAFRGFLTGF
jgi:hypothetical protein